MGCFRSPPPWRKTAPLKRPIKRSMKNKVSFNDVLGGMFGDVGSGFAGYVSYGRQMPCDVKFLQETFRQTKPKKSQARELSGEHSGTGLENPFWLRYVLGQILKRGQQVLNPAPLNPTPATYHKRKRKLRCNIRQKLRCRSSTATFAFLQCRRHFDQKLRCCKRKTALQH